ncbi:MAG: SDR family NAD(P)-dependent oxidoreductase [Blautia sp.]
MQNFRILPSKQQTKRTLQVLLLFCKIHFHNNLLLSSCNVYLFTFPYYNSIFLKSKEKPKKSIRNEKEGDVTFLKADVSSADDCRNVVETVMKKYGRIDVLANVAGVVGTRGAFVDLDLADIQNTI